MKFAIFYHSICIYAHKIHIYRRFNYLYFKVVFFHSSNIGNRSFYVGFILMYIFEFLGRITSYHYLKWYIIVRKRH